MKIETGPITTAHFVECHTDSCGDNSGWLDGDGGEASAMDWLFEHKEATGHRDYIKDALTRNTVRPSIA